jgi:serine/threonine-protein kinase RsbT
MPIEKSDELPIRSAEDIVRVRQAVREWGIEIGLSLVDQTKIVTAASELARNTLDYGGGGSATLHLLREGNRRGVRVIFDDKGPGIPDLDLALKDGYTTGNGLGLGLSGARRLSNEFDLRSAPGQGTTVTITRWKG